MKNKKVNKAKRKKFEWIGEVLGIVAIAGFFVLLIFMAYSAGRSSKGAEMSAEAQEFSYMHYWIDGTHYINFYTRVGGMSTVNFTLDSMKKTMYNPPPVTIQVMPIDTLNWKE